MIVSIYDDIGVEYEAMKSFHPVCVVPLLEVASRLVVVLLDDDCDIIRQLDGINDQSNQKDHKIDRELLMLRPMKRLEIEFLRRLKMKVMTVKSSEIRNQDKIKLVQMVKEKRNDVLRRVI